MSKKHSHIGASSSDRWMNCPGSVILSDPIPPTPASVYAEEGTAAHELAEEALKTGKNAIEFLGQVFNDFEVTEEMAECVQIYLNHVRSLPNDVSGIETRVSLAWIDPNLFGTSDAHRGKLNDVLEVIDYKHGAGVPVDVYENSQVLYYTLGVAQKYDFAFKTYRGTIAQPRAPHNDGPIRIWEFSRERLLQFEKELKQALVRIRQAEKANDIMKHLSYGKWCKWCPARAVCPLISQQAAITAREDFDPVTDDITVIGPTPPHLMTTEKLAHALRMADVIESWISGVRSYAQYQAELGREIPGFKLVTRKGHRKWQNEKKVVDALTFLGYSEEEIHAPRKVKTPAQLEKIVRDKNWVNAFAAAPDIGSILVPETDARDSKNPAIEDFSLVDG